MVANIADRMINQVGAEMIGAARLQMNGPIVLIEFWIPLIGQCAMEAVPTAESAPKRPVILRPCGTVICDVCKVPFAHSIGAVGVIPQDFGNGRGLSCDLPPITWITARPFGNDSHPNGMRVAAGKQASAGGRAH